MGIGSTSASPGRTADAFGTIYVVSEVIGQVRASRLPSWNDPWVKQSAMSHTQTSFENHWIWEHSLALAFEPPRNRVADAGVFYHLC